MRHPRLAILLCVSLVAPKLAWADRATEDAQAAAAFAAANNDSDNLPTFEKRVLKRAQGRAERHGSTLTLSLESGNRLRLNDQNYCDINEERCKFYYLVAVLPSRHAYIVVIGYYEGADALWIDSRTGKETAMDGPPIFGPDGHQFLVLNIGNSTDSVVSLWTVGPDQPTEIWNDHGCCYDGPVKLLHWETPDRIELEIVNYGELDKPSRHLKASLWRDIAGWHLEVQPPKQ